jgi:hypothetical protein
MGVAERSAAGPMSGKRESLERGAPADLWRHTLSQIPCLFGRLVYLASLRNSNTGRYEHHGLALVFGEEESDNTLRDSHDKAFCEWLTYGLEAQKADLDLYLSSLAADKRTLLRTWQRLAPYRNMIPASARAADRGLYMADLEALLEMLRNEHGVAGPDPDA